MLCYVDKAQNCWDEHLVQIAGALRSAVNRNSGFTAKKLMLGRGDGQYSGRPPLRCTQTGDPVDFGAYLDELEGALQTAHESARGLFCTSEERMKQDYD